MSNVVENVLQYDASLVAADLISSGGIGAPFIFGDMAVTALSSYIEEPCPQLLRYGTPAFVAIALAVSGVGAASIAVVLVATCSRPLGAHFLREISPRDIVRSACLSAPVVALNILTVGYIGTPFIVADFSISVLLGIGWTHRLTKFFQFDSDSALQEIDQCLRTHSIPLLCVLRAKIASYEKGDDLQPLLQYVNACISLIREFGLVREPQVPLRVLESIKRKIEDGDYGLPAVELALVPGILGASLVAGVTFSTFGGAFLAVSSKITLLVGLIVFIKPAGKICEAICTAFTADTVLLVSEKVASVVAPTLMFQVLPLGALLATTSLLPALTLIIVDTLGTAYAWHLLRENDSDLEGFIALVATPIILGAISVYLGVIGGSVVAAVGLMKVANYIVTEKACKLAVALILKN